MISNSGHDERGKYSGGKAGDQTGTEWAIINWYNRPWKCVLRHPNAAVREKIAELSEKAAKNDNIGYDQSERTTYWNELKKAGYDPEKIKTPCEADCSAGVMANVKAVGYLLQIEALKNVTITSTYYMRNMLVNAGFDVLTGTKYLTSGNELLRGDILLNDGAHTAVNLTNGSKAGGSNTKGYLSKGDKGNEVKEMQTRLIACGYSCGSSGADGDFGNGTDAALRKFQKDNNLTVDGCYGAKSKSKLEVVYNAKKSASTAATSNKKIKVDSAKSFDYGCNGRYVVTAGDYLCLRAGAGTQKTELARMKKDESVTCYGYYTDVAGTRWLLVVYKQITGFVSSKYLKKK